jgi:hypothetical protein
VKRALAAPYSSHFSASHLFQSAVKKMAGGKGGWWAWEEGGKMPGNSQPMQCGNSSVNYKVLKKKEKLSRNGRLLKEIRGCGHRAEGGRLSWWLGDAWSGCPVAQPRLPMQCLPGFDFLMSSMKGGRCSRAWFSLDCIRQRTV